MLYKIENNEIKSRIKSQNFKLEKELQNFFEKNIIHILPNYEFLATELSIANFRFDSLFFDRENNSFVIVEYKRNEKDSIVDQGYAYLNIVDAHKDSLVLAYNNVKKEFREKKAFNWGQTRMLFVAPAFTQRQKEATNNKKLPFDLMTVNKYEGNIIDIDYINKSFEAEVIDSKLSPHITPKTENDYLKKVDEAIKELYINIRDEVSSWDENIKIVPKRIYMAFKLGSNFMDIEFTKKYLRISLNLKKGQLKDGNQLTRDMSNTGHGGNGDYEAKVDEKTDYNYLLSLIKQSYDFQKKNF